MNRCLSEKVVDKVEEWAKDTSPLKQSYQHMVCEVTKDIDDLCVEPARWDNDND